MAHLPLKQLVIIIIWSFLCITSTINKRRIMSALHEIQERMVKASRLAGREASDTQLIAISKTRTVEEIRPLLQSGHRLFGENRVQEAASRWPDLRQKYDGVSVHLIGPLQTNKARAAMELFDVIHTVDRPKLARKLADAIQSRGRAPTLFIQVNTGEEPQKAGVLPADADAFIADCRAMDLPIAGLMAIPPADEEPALHFALLKKIADRNDVPELSMGMSGDFETAVRMGATCVRVGSGVFGARDYAAKAGG